MFPTLLFYFFAVLLRCVKGNVIQPNLRDRGQIIDLDYFNAIFPRSSGSLAKLSLDSCGNDKGVCITSAACPWARIIADDGEKCAELHYGNNQICCEVARVRMPVDMFTEFQ
ncbi:hypothetical protein K1T71_002752 [Dendrolimus kikuchii]|uniref:Uncharacterized protein n=1 Tax=Dendrolimus kikuchii TaxID=765133 RepID=A0ACC1DDX5_9NEOP|nr:hypothetical protein K1T71_002752 [Dendrolimus kikuchii]